MKATLLDTITGEKRIVEGIRSWEWAENNWSCDCNRRTVFDIDDDICKCERFLVIDYDMCDADDYEFDIYELNDEYPKELIEQYIKYESAWEKLDGKIADVNSQISSKETLRKLKAKEIEQIDKVI